MKETLQRMMLRQNKDLIMGSGVLALLTAFLHSFFNYGESNEGLLIWGTSVTLWLMLQLVSGQRWFLKNVQQTGMAWLLPVNWEEYAQQFKRFATASAQGFTAVLTASLLLRFAVIGSEFKSIYIDFIRLEVPVLICGVFGLFAIVRVLSGRYKRWLPAAIWPVALCLGMWIGEIFLFEYGAYEVSIICGTSIDLALFVTGALLLRKEWKRLLHRQTV